MCGPGPDCARPQLRQALTAAGPMCAPELEPLPLAAVTERLLHLLPVFHGMHMPHSIGEAAVGERRDLRSCGLHRGP